MISKMAADPVACAVGRRMSRAVVFPLVVGALLVTGPQSVRMAGQLAPTSHPSLPSNASDLWFVPSANDRAARTTATYQPLADAVNRYQQGDYSGALALVKRPTLQATALADYAAYYAGLSQLRLGQHAEARKTFDALRGKTQGYLATAAPIGSAEAAEALGDNGDAVRIYERLADDKATVSDGVLSRLGRAALSSGDRKKAAQAFLRIYYEFPLTDAAIDAAGQIERLQDQIVRTSYQPDFGRAQLMFGAHRYAEAKTAYQALQRVAGGDDRELADLRVAECDFYSRQYGAARDGVRPYLERASRKAEARFFYLSALRELGNGDEYIAQTAALVAEFPDSSWSEEALNNLGTYYILAHEDDLAAQAFRQLYEKFPAGQRSERAAWKYGWFGYRQGEYAETVRVFESAAANFPRSDYRPSYLYWAARAHAKLGEGELAEARLRLVYTDYGNSYYGRLAQRQLSRLPGGGTPPGLTPASNEQPPASAPAIPTAGLIRLLLANGLYDDAFNELHYAQRAWGSSSAIDATIAWAYHQKGDLRRAITLMRRAYPQHLTSAGQLPPEILQVIFPLTYWESIKKQSALHGLDPYVVAALIAQESTFDAGIKSVANAWGLMQVVPSTGRRLARSLGIRNFTTKMLTNPDVNLRLGTLYFSRLIEQFGGSYYALASYNAGETRVVRWKSERPGLEEDEFIDDIPFPETQNYVKRILGTAEDYRMLYGNGEGMPTAAPRPSVAAKSSVAPSKKPATKKPATKKPAAKKRSAPKKTVGRGL